ncbi:MAG: Inosine-5'-monophosphate dehydrogenase [Thermoanaerobaculia bacterium]|nr:Inosine-5'-monophosphate dehydrogenase [Thermoanaerobaculia bacterium]
MPVPYAVIEVFTSERPGRKGKAPAAEIVRKIASLRVPARAIVQRGSSGSFENGEVASTSLEVLSFALPVKIEIVLPERFLDQVLPAVEALVSEGVVLVRRSEASLHSMESQLVPRHLTTADVMTPHPVSVTGATSVRQALEILLKSPFHGLPVVDSDGRPVGIVTQGDLIRKGGIPIRFGLLPELGAEPAAGLMEDLEGKVCRDVMTSPVVTVKAGDPLPHAVRVLLDRGLKRLPVTDDAGRLVGMLARLDIIRVITLTAPDLAALAREEIRIGGVRLVKDVLETRTSAVEEGASIEEVLRQLAAASAQRLSVVDSEGRLVGIISDRDVLVRFAESRKGLWRLLASSLGIGSAGGESTETARKATAASIMTRNPVTVTPETPIQDAFKLMLERGLKRLPVVDSNGKLLGMAGRDALLRCAVSGAGSASSG